MHFLPPSYENSVYFSHSSCDMFPMSLHEDKLNTRQIQCNTRMIMAAKDGDTDTVRALLAQQADVHACQLDKMDKKADCALRNAAHHGHTDTVRVLLAHKADVHACGYYDGKPDDALRWAANNGHTETVRVLLAHKADVHACDYFYKPDAALRNAAFHGRTETVRLLIDHKANVHACDGKIGVLYWAALNGHLNTVDVLLAHGHADVGHLPTSFIEKYLNVTIDTSSDNMARCMRLGMSILSSLAQKHPKFNLDHFETLCRSWIECISSSLREYCSDLCEFVMLYV